MHTTQRHQLPPRDDAQAKLERAGLHNDHRLQIVQRPAVGPGVPGRPGKAYTLYAWGVFAGNRLQFVIRFNRRGAATFDEPMPAEQWQPECDCCQLGGEYNGFGSDGPRLFTCPKSCPCHD